MRKALNAVILVVGIVLIILAAVGVGGLVFTILGDVLVVGGVLFFLILRKTSGPPVESTE